MRSRLAAEGVDTSAVESHPSRATSTTAVLIDPSGERSFAHHVGAPHAIDLAFVRRLGPHWARCRVALVGVKLGTRGAVLSEKPGGQRNNVTI